MSFITMYQNFEFTDTQTKSVTTIPGLPLLSLIQNKNNISPFSAPTMTEKQMCVSLGACVAKLHTKIARLDILGTIVWHFMS